MWTIRSIGASRSATHPWSDFQLPRSASQASSVKRLGGIARLEEEPGDTLFFTSAGVAPTSMQSTFFTEATMFLDHCSSFRRPSLCHVANLRCDREIGIVRRLDCGSYHPTISTPT